MFHNFGIGVAKIFKNAEAEMLSLNHPYVGSEHLLLSILNSNDELVGILNSYNLTYNLFKDELINIVGKSTKKSSTILYTPLLKRVIDIALSDAKENNNGTVTPTHLFLAILEEGEGIALRLMIGMNINIDLLYQKLKNQKIKPKQNNLLVYEIGNVLNNKVDVNDKVIGRDKIINNIIETLLRKNKNNPLLIGEAGVGKTAIIEELARRIINNQVPKELLNKNIVMLEMSFLVSGTKYRGEFEERVTKIIDEVKENDNIILFIDEIHTLVGAGGAEGAIDASNILKPYLARGDIKCIGATTVKEYRKSVFKDKALDRRFQIINVDEPDLEETIKILKGIKSSYENHHQVKISNKNINDIVTLANKYIFDKCNPDKCIDILDSVCAKVKLRIKKDIFLEEQKESLNRIILEKTRSILNNNYEQAVKLKDEEQKIIKEIANKKANKYLSIHKGDILEVISNKVSFNLLEDKNRIIRKLRKDLKNNIIEQNSKYEILEAIKNHSSNKPISILITGPTGCGKTHTAKVLADSFGKDSLLKIDMNEFNNEVSISKLIGTSQGYVGYNDEHILSNINNKQIILIDEIDKASKKVLNLFLNILDEGYIKDAKGEIIHFNNKLIIITANKNNQEIVGFNNTLKKDNNFLTKELLSRINKVINYETISLEGVKTYLKVYLKLKDQNQINDIIAKSEYQKYGLRNINHLTVKN